MTRVKHWSSGKVERGERMAYWKSKDLSVVIRANDLVFSPTTNRNIQWDSWIPLQKYVLNKQIPSTDSASATRLSAQRISAVHRALCTVSPSLMKTKVSQAKKIGLFYLFIFFKRLLNYEHLKNYLYRVGRRDLWFQFWKHGKRNEIKSNSEE